MTDALVLLAPVALLALVLLLRGLHRRFRRNRSISPINPAGRPIIVDGSNVLYWKDNAPDIATLREVLAQLTAQGFQPGVVFDANAGYLIEGRYRHHHAMGRLLDLPEEQVMVVPKGEPADRTILAAARDLGAPIVSNDRYRDWAEAYPEVSTPGHIIRGTYRDGHLHIDLPAP